jgi:hypothetical protein
MFGRAVAVALPVHGINCRNDNHDNEWDEASED